MLEIKSLTKTFGKLRAVDNFNMEVEKGEVKALIGPNGAGKTTVVNLVTGVLLPDNGRIRLDNHCLLKLAPYKRIKVGISRTYQIPKPYLNLTVLENVLVSSYFGAGLKGEEAVSNAIESLKFVGLYSMANKSAKELNSEQQKLLDFARALSIRPKYIMIDEIGAGLGISEQEEIASKIRELGKKGLGVIYIGHLMKMVKAVSDTVVVMNEGKKIFEGSYEDAVNNEEVIKIYLGERHAKS
ncbi:MAG: ABC transporter ATP-binding protein [Caldisphaera sp.]|jgi:branched-chain amino acid transport system ATP-binding protein|uniref:ABC transporter ATP-binding protein n=1 Tax=Caldisphaera sp. TaxID=2060322 RepID=UPI00397BD68C